MANHTRRMRSALLTGCLSAASLALLAACGSSGGAQSDGKGGTSDHVASITTPSTGSGGGSSAKPSASSSDGGRPQLRMDTSQAEVQRLDAVYFGCLHDHGVPSAHKPGSGNTWSPGGDATKYPAAYKACASKQPLQPPEEDPAKNPHYADDFRADIKCLNDGGLGVHALSTPGEWTFDSPTPTMSDAQEQKLQRKCELQSYK